MADETVKPAPEPLPLTPETVKEVRDRADNLMIIAEGQMLENLKVEEQELPACYLVHRREGLIRTLCDEWSELKEEQSSDGVHPTADEAAEPEAEVTALTAGQVKEVRDAVKEWKEGLIRHDAPDDRHYDWLIQLCNEWDSLKDTNLIDGEIFSMIAEALDIDGEKVPPSFYNDLIRSLKHDLSRANAKAAFATATLEAHTNKKQCLIHIHEDGMVVVDGADLYVPPYHEAWILGYSMSTGGSWTFSISKWGWWKKLRVWITRATDRKLVIANFHNPVIRISTRDDSEWCYARNNTRTDGWCHVVDNTWDTDPTSL